MFILSIRYLPLFFLFTAMISVVAAEPSLPSEGGANGLAKATFAGGCFWCMEPPFDQIAGVVSTTSGYTGGTKTEPSYKEVSSGTTGHAEAIQVLFDPKTVSYEKLLMIFWRNIDPLAKDSQFCDVGHQYRSAIFYHDTKQKQLAEASKAVLEDDPRFAGKIVTGILPVSEFYPAEETHQDYYRKNPLLYKFYRYTCGRDRRLTTLWETVKK